MAYSEARSKLAGMVNHVETDSDPDLLFEAPRAGNTSECPRDDKAFSKNFPAASRASVTRNRFVQH